MANKKIIKKVVKVEDDIGQPKISKIKTGLIPGIALFKLKKSIINFYLFS